MGVAEIKVDLHWLIKYASLLSASVAQEGM